MNAPVKRLTKAIRSHAHSSGLDTDALDELAGYNLAGFFGMLFEIEQRIKSETLKTTEKTHENQ